MVGKGGGGGVGSSKCVKQEGSYGSSIFSYPLVAAGHLGPLLPRTIMSSASWETIA